MSPNLSPTPRISVSNTTSALIQRLGLVALGCTLLLGLSIPASHGATDPELQSFESGAHKVSLIELYTSEGCSSCPPADRWLSGLKDGDALWRNVVPVAFHVSYWDRLGWPDKFAQRKFDGRQRELAGRANAAVYTPGMFRDGAEFRDWRYSSKRSLNAALAAASERTTAPGELKLEEQKNGYWSLSYTPAAGVAAPQPVEAYVALLGNSLANNIARGENAGKVLSHDFVALDLQKLALAKTHNVLMAKFKLDPAITTTPAVAAWVVDPAGNPLQAVGGEL